MADKNYKLTFEMSDGSTKEVIFTSPQGEAGKSAYEYAVAGGYTGTEAEFAEKLAEESPKRFYVNLELTDDGMTVDKTYEEIDAAYTGGRNVFLVIPSLMLETNYDVFCPLAGKSSDPGFVFTMAGLLVGRSNAIVGYAVVLADGSVNIDSMFLANEIDIPTKLPNPYGLDINGVYYSGGGYVNYTGTINGMIDSKIPVVPDILEIEALIDEKLGVIENGSY